MGLYTGRFFGEKKVRGKEGVFCKLKVAHPHIK
jgi:hypothetical protein